MRSMYINIYEREFRGLYNGRRREEKLRTEDFSRDPYL